MDPIISPLSIAGQLTQPETGFYDVSPGVPIGYIFSVAAVSANGIPFQSVTWTGGTNYAAYLQGSASGAPPDTMSVTKGVATTNTDYTFIVDATPRSYTVTATVTYIGDATEYSSEVTFNSLVPSVSITPMNHVGVPTLVRADSNGSPDPNGLYMTMSYQSDDFESATTANPSYGGSFMYMQTGTIANSYTDSLGATWDQNNVGGGANFDGGSTSTLGYQAFYVPDKGMVDSWMLPPGKGPETAVTSDQPSMTVPGNYKSFSMNDQFSMYIMYQATPNNSSVWIAVAQINWNFSGSAENNQGNWTISAFTGPVPGPATTPTGDAAFPSWTGLLADTHFVEQD